MPSNNDIIREYIQGDIRNGQIFDDRYVDKMETGIEASFHYSNYLEEHFGNEINNTKEELTQYTDDAKAAAIAHTDNEIAKTRTDLTAYTDAALEALDYNGASESGTATQFITQITQADGLVSATKASVPTANDTTIGMVKQGGDVTISNGIITVNDDSHNHIISNIDGLQSALDSKATPANITSAIAALDYTSPATNGTALEFITTVNQADGVVSATKAAIPVASSDTLGLVKSGTDITVDSSGNVSVNNNSHTHTSANISDLSTTISNAITNAIGALDASDPAASGSATQFITSISQKDGVITAKKANITAAELGLSGAMKFLGTSATEITDGATTNPITIGSTSTTVASGNVVLYGSKEFVWTGSAWEELGNEGSYKIQQSAVSSPSASGTETAFIDTISQNAQGVITATKKTVASATQSAAGLMSAADKTKLDGIAEGANNYTYTLPTASSSILGGVKIGTGIAISNGIISNSGVRSISTGTQNGTISVNTNGTAENVAVKGLGSAAYKDALGTWEINITGSSGSCTGNAETATKLATARTIALTGSVTGSGSFDGSGDLNITTTTNHTHNYAGSSSEGGIATSSYSLANKETLDTQDKLDNFLTAARVEYAMFGGSNNVGFGSNDGMVLSLAWTDTRYGAQIAFDDVTSTVVKVRGKAHSWGNWYTLLHSGNYTDYTVTKTGSGASGTWPISITGSAATATKATQDSDGNTIASTYATKSELNNVSTLVGNTAVSTQITNAINGLNIKNGSYQGIRQVTSTEEGTDYYLGQGAVALGTNTKATNLGCFACGGDTTASGEYSHAEGSSTTASGVISHAEGYSTTASGADSHAEGIGTIASSDYQHVQGRYNIEDASYKYAHIVGNGYSAPGIGDIYSNAHTLDWSGNAWFQGSIYVGGEGQTDTAAIKILPAKLVSTETTPRINDTIYWLYE